MIEATVMRTVWNDGKTGYEVKAKGHAGAGKYGQDIVCAAVSCLMQTLANEVEEAARAGLVALGAVAHGEGWMRVEVTPTHESCDMVEAWVELVQDGLDALAESYPENVELVVNMVFADGKAPDPAQLPDMVDGKMNLQLFAATEATTASGRNREPRLGPWPAGHECRPRHEVDAGSHNPFGGMDLQLFAEGGGDGGAAGDGAEAAPAVQAPELRPAQERLAKRSRPGRAVKAALAPSAEGGADAGTPTKEEPSKEEAPGEEKPETQQGQPEQEPKPTDPAEKRKAFGQLMQGEYAAEFEEALQRASEMAVQNVLDNPAVKGLMDALGEAYGIDVQSADNLAALTEAVKNGKVKNDEYYETLAAERGISVKTAREMDRMESELQRANAEKQRAEQIRQAAEHQQRAAAVRAQWEAEAAQLKVKYPAFELDEVLNNPSVADMIRRGIGLEAAYRAAYFDQLMEASTARTAQQVEQGVTARIQQRAQRPAENGAHPGGAAEMKVDVAHMTAKQRAELAKRARRGERIVL